MRKNKTINLLLKKLTLVFLALQILNLSIYNTDFYNFHTYTSVEIEDLNPVDSFAELILESVDGYENTFPESNEKQQDKPASDLKHNITFKLIKLDFFTGIDDQHSFAYAAVEREPSVFQNKYSFLFFEEINHPPS